jgi:hypothetical protein
METVIRSMEMFHTADGYHVLEVSLLPQLDQIVIDFARTKYQALHAAHVLRSRSMFGDDPYEFRVLSHLGERGFGLRVVQQRFGRHQDQRLAKSQ